MAEHTVTVTWQRSTPDFDYKTFDRTHTWWFSGGQVLHRKAKENCFIANLLRTEVALEPS
jgi:hypothetical protein